MADLKWIYDSPRATGRINWSKLAFHFPFAKLLCFEFPDLYRFVPYFIGCHLHKLLIYSAKIIHNESLYCILWS